MSLQLLAPASVGGLTTGRKKPALVGPAAALPSSIGAEIRVRVQLIDHFKPCMTEICLHIVARMADYMDTRPYVMPHP